MVAVEQAKQIILENVQTLSRIRLPLEQSFGKRLAEDIYAPIDLPAFAQAGMDGYAFRFEKEEQPIRSLVKWLRDLIFIMI